MALSTILGVGIGLIAVGAMQLAGYPGGAGWVVGGVVAIIVGYAAKSMK